MVVHGHEHRLGIVPRRDQPLDQALDGTPGSIGLPPAWRPPFSDTCASPSSVPTYSSPSCFCDSGDLADIAVERGRLVLGHASGPPPSITGGALRSSARVSRRSGPSSCCLDRRCDTTRCDAVYSHKLRACGETVMAYPSSSGPAPRLGPLQGRIPIRSPVSARQNHTMPPPWLSA